MRRWRVIALAVALFLVCLLAYPLSSGFPDYFTSLHVTSHTALNCVPHLFLIAGKTSTPHHFQANKNSGRKKTETDCGGSLLSVFRGREAKLNRAIFLVLFHSCPLVVYDITKEVKKRKGYRFTKYSNVNRRVRALVQQGYLESVGSRETQAGSQGTLYQPTIRAKAAFYFNAISPDQFIREANDEALTTELAALALFLERTNLQK
jgi:dolichol kinase